MVKTLTFTPQEAEALAGLLHAACLKDGLAAANPAAVWQLKIQNAKPEKKALKAVKDK